MWVGLYRLCPVAGHTPIFHAQVHFRSATQSCLTLCSPMDCSTPGFPVLPGNSTTSTTRAYSNSCQLSRWCHPTISSSVIPCHTLLSPSPPAFNLSQHQDLFKWVNSSHQVAKVLAKVFTFQWIFRTDVLYDWLVWSPWSPRDSQEPSPTLRFKRINSSVLFIVQL